MRVFCQIFARLRGQLSKFMDLCTRRIIIFIVLSQLKPQRSPIIWELRELGKRTPLTEHWDRGGSSIKHKGSSCVVEADKWWTSNLFKYRKMVGMEIRKYLEEIIKQFVDDTGSLAKGKQPLIKQCEGNFRQSEGIQWLGQTCCHREKCFPSNDMCWQLMTKNAISFNLRWSQCQFQRYVLLLEVLCIGTRKNGTLGDTS